MLLEFNNHWDLGLITMLCIGTIIEGVYNYIVLTRKMWCVLATSPSLARRHRKPLMSRTESR